MEEYANNKIETFDELITKHTRRDLEELALKYGTENLGGTKSQLAESILEAMKKQKEPPKSTPQVSPTLQVSPIPQVSPKEAPMIEKSKPAAKVATVGKKGVMAKVTALNSKTAEMKQGIAVFKKSVAVQSKENQEAAAKIYSGARAIQSGIDSQIKENQEAAAKFNSGVKTLQKENHEAAAKIYSGAKAIQSGIDAQIKENHMAAAKIHSGAVSLQNEIHRYQEQDLKNYVRDFYYG